MEDAQSYTNEWLQHSKRPWCHGARTILVGHDRGGVAQVALLEDVLGGGSMSRLHLVAVMTSLGSQLLGKSLVAYQVSLSCLHAIATQIQ